MDGTEKQARVFNSLRVLIAEDDTLTALNLKEQLQALGHEVVGIAETGCEAVQAALTLNVDLITMDIVMPDMSGLVAARDILQHAPIPIIMITGHADAELVAEAAEAGVMAYLVKPIGEKDLRTAIPIAIQRFREMQSIREELKDLRETLETRKLVERAKGILMRRRHLSEEEAFRMIQKESQNRNKKMGDIARAIIEAENFIS